MVIAETVTLTDGNTFTQKGSLRITQNGVVSADSYAESGVYSRDGAELMLVFSSDGTTATGTVSANTVIVGVRGLSLVYRKQSAGHGRAG